MMMMMMLMWMCVNESREATGSSRGKVQSELNGKVSAFQQDNSIISMDTGAVHWTIASLVLLG
jgi:hypothetical protein